MSRISSPTKRRATPLGYAFSTDGWLDPGTKLLDVGLDSHTPVAALRTLVEEPLHMSVALHEITHFVSLENALGYVMGFLAMHAQTAAEAIEENSERGQPVDISEIEAYAAWQKQYRLLLELWRPLLEGLAVYAQTHEPHENGDALIEPVQLLWHWKLSMVALGKNHDAELRAATIDEGFLHSLYRTIRQGPSLQLGDNTLAAGLEFVQPEGLRPYFLGHAYLRTLQRCLAQACADYANSERFFNLVLRILRSSTRGLFRDPIGWDQPAMASRIYDWIDIVRKAPADRVVALRGQGDPVDVLHFLVTGEERLGYTGKATEDLQALSEAAPGFWNAFVSELADRPFDELASEAGDPPLDMSPDQLAMRLATAGARGNMSLNLSSGGDAWLAGWVPNGLDPLHALALRVDNATWWLAVNDEQIATLVGVNAQLLELPASVLMNGDVAERTTLRVSMNCFVMYLPSEFHGEPPKLMPSLRIELTNVSDPERKLLTELAPARIGMARAHLQVLSDPRALEFHRNAMLLRQVVCRARTHDTLANTLYNDGHAGSAAALWALKDKEDLAVERVQAHSERRILAAILEREPPAGYLAMLERGVGVVAGAIAFEPLITATYSTSTVVDGHTARRVHRLNRDARAAIGKPLFDLDTSRLNVRYLGLWGGPES
jgi:hypothetical protein